MMLRESGAEFICDTPGVRVERCEGQWIRRIRDEWRPIWALILLR